MGAKPASSSVLTSTPWTSAPICSPSRLISSMTWLHLPVLGPGRVRADALLGHLHVEKIWAVLARDLLHATPESGLELLHRRHMFAVHSLSAREAHVVGGGTAEMEPGILALPHHLGVRHLAGPVVA